LDLSLITWLKQCGNWVRRVLAWLGDAYLLWIAVLAIPTLFALACIVFQSWEERIRITGMCLELLGLATVALGLRETRKLFNQPGLLQLAERWLREFPTFYRNVRIVTGTGHMSMGDASATGFASASASANASLEERVAILEKSLNQTNMALQEAQEKIDEETQKRTRALEAERQNRETGDESNRRLLQEAMAGGLHLETMGVLWLFTGITLATASSEISRWLTGS